MRIGVIGGGDFFKSLNVPTSREHVLSTPYGDLLSPIREAMIGEHVFLSMVRHGKKHEVAAHNVNYRANIWALASLKPDLIISLSVCGTVQFGIKVGTVILFDQVIDQTRKRINSFYDQGEVRHIDMYEPTCQELARALSKDLTENKISYIEGGTLICVEGPRFSTKAELDMFRQWGASYINMSSAPEIFLINEMDIPCLPISLVSDSIDDAAPTLAGISENIALHKDAIPKTIKILAEETLKTYVLPPRSSNEKNGALLLDKLNLPV